MLLLVEDEALLRSQWVQALRTVGRVREAGTAREALDELDGADILVLDWRLNGDGDNVLDRWMGSQSGPVCIVSGYLDRQHQDDLYMRGVHHVLGKPLGLAVLVGVVRRYANQVEREKRIEVLEKRVLQLWYTVGAALFLLAVVAGERVIPLLERLIGP